WDSASEISASLVNALRNRKVSSRCAVSVSVVGDLILARATREFPSDQLTELVDLIPLDDPALEGLHEAGMTFLFDRLTPICYDKCSALHGPVVVLATAALDPATLHE